MRDIVKQLPDITVALLDEHVERTPARPIAGNFGGREPSAVHVAEEIVPRPHAQIAR